jgi:ATP-dependent Clp endopeptidase proteolytic subunit ClpP
MWHGDCEINRYGNLSRKKELHMARINRESLDLFFEHGLELSSRTIYIGYGMNDEYDTDEKVAADVIKGLVILSSSNSEAPIQLIINNQGGDAIHGLAIYDAIRNVGNPVIATVYGHCYSIGAWILQAADHRRISKHSSLMIHHGSGDKTQFDRELDDRCVDILLDRIHEKQPDFTRKQLDKMLLKDSFLWPEEALKLGLVDEIVDMDAEASK